MRPWPAPSGRSVGIALIANYRSASKTLRISRFATAEPKAPEMITGAGVPTNWRLAPRQGFEPRTYRLTADRSTVELPRNNPFSVEEEPAIRNMADAAQARMRAFPGERLAIPAASFKWRRISVWHALLASLNARSAKLEWTACAGGCSLYAKQLTPREAAHYRIDT